MAIDLGRGIITGDFESTITHATEGSIEFEGKDRKGSAFAYGNSTWKGNIDRVTGRLFIIEEQDSWDPSNTKRTTTDYMLKCQRRTGPVF